MMRQRRGGGGGTSITSSATILSEEEDQCDDDDDDDDDNQIMNVVGSSLLDLSSSSKKQKNTTRSSLSWLLLLLLFPKRLLRQQKQQKQQEKTVVVTVVRFILFLLLMIVLAMLLFEDPNHHQDQPTNLIYKPIKQETTDTYDVYDCPIIPPINYPREYPILDVLKNWPTNRTTSSNFQQQQQQQKIYQGVCIIDVSSKSVSNNPQQIISNYRSAEVPFIIRNDPKVLRAVNLWSTSSQSYHLSRKLRHKKYQATISNQTKLTYFSMDPNYNIIPNDFIPPTEHIPLSYDDWYQHSSSSSSSSSTTTTTTNHQDENKNKNYKYAYLRLDACLPNLKRCDTTYDPTKSSSNNIYDNADFIYNDLDFFRPSSSESESESNYYDIDMNKTRGIQCRLSPPGIIADENHFDNERNYIAMIKGKRRYLLSHPQNCPTLYLYKQKHPFERHTSIDYNYISELLLLKNDDANQNNQNSHNNHNHIINELYPDFYKTTINEVVLEAGDVLYLPTYWFHHIISLDLNYQCNTRSGYSVEYDQIIYDCGFFYDFPS